jgi:hypothetical protein
MQGGSTPDWRLDALKASSSKVNSTQKFVGKSSSFTPTSVPNVPGSKLKDGARGVTVPTKTDPTPKWGDDVEELDQNALKITKLMEEADRKLAEEEQTREREKEEINTETLRPNPKQASPVASHVPRTENKANKKPLSKPERETPGEELHYGEYKDEQDLEQFATGKGHLEPTDIISFPRNIREFPGANRSTQSADRQVAVLWASICRNISSQIVTGPQRKQKRDRHYVPLLGLSLFQCRDAVHRKLAEEIALGYKTQFRQHRNINVAFIGGVGIYPFAWSVVRQLTQDSKDDLGLFCHATLQLGEEHFRPRFAAGGHFQTPFNHNLLFEEFKPEQHGKVATHYIPLERDEFGSSHLNWPEFKRRHHDLVFLFPDLMKQKAGLLNHFDTLTCLGTPLAQVVDGIFNGVMPDPKVVIIIKLPAGTLLEFTNPDWIVTDKVHKDAKKPFDYIEVRRKPK